MGASDGGWSRLSVVTADDRDDREDGGWDDEHHIDPDVSAARSNVRNARVGYGPVSGRRRPPPRGRRGWVREFVYRYGWRAYALPILSVVTVLALATTGTVAKQGGGGDKDAAAPPAGSRSSAPPTAGERMNLKNDEKGKNFSDEALKAAALPDGPAYSTRGTGKFQVLKGTSPKVGTGQLFRYSIDVEKGVSGVDLAQFQKLVVQTMADKRSWSGHGVAVQRVDSGRIDFHVTMTSIMTVRKICGYTIPVETSCYAQADAPNSKVDSNRVVFNVARWVRGATAYVGDLAAYRVYMINHENGHALGHRHAHQCLPGGLAPLMMQQTLGLRDAKSGQLCQANPWPYPTGVKGAPGKEQQDTDENNEYGIGD